VAASIFCRGLGPGTFTGRLHARVTAGRPLRLRVDGPYGLHPLALPAARARYVDVLLVAGVSQISKPVLRIY
jgi:hypothetical protein